MVHKELPAAAGPLATDALFGALASIDPGVTLLLGTEFGALGLAEFARAEQDAVV